MRPVIQDTKAIRAIAITAGAATQPPSIMMALLPVEVPQMNKPPPKRAEVKITKMATGNHFGMELFWCIEHLLEQDGNTIRYKEFLFKFYTWRKLSKNNKKQD